MADWATLLTFTLACIAIIIVPGPTVTVIIANSLSRGSSAGFMNVAGTQAGLAIMMGILALGLQTVVAFVGEAFFYLKLIGAAYLIWLGVQLWLANGSLADPDEVKRPSRSMAGYFWQGFFVIWSNPKALLFFGAFIPQFIDPSGSLALQTLILGGIFMLCATIFDGLYAIAAGSAGGWLSRNKIRVVERVSGSLLIGGGVWMLFSGRGSST
ncbi:MAG: LysE family translocator [Pseudomonadota bacterium]